MTLDSSYYSTVRNPSELNLTLIKNQIFFGSDGELIKATLKGFDYYSDGEFSRDVGVERTIGKLSKLSEWQSVKANENGEFESSEVGVFMAFDTEQMPKCVYLVVNENLEMQSLELEKWNATIEKKAGVIKLKISRPPSVSPDHPYRVWCKFEKAAPNDEVIIKAIICSSENIADTENVVTVNRRDIESATFNFDGDITGGKLTKCSSSVILFDRDKKYSSNDFNALIFDYVYKNKDGSMYVSEPKALFIENNGITTEQTQELARTTIKSSDILSLMQDEYFADRSINLTDKENIDKCILYFNNRNPNNFLVDSYMESSAQEIYVNQFEGEPCNSALQSISFASSRLFLPENDCLKILDRKFEGEYSKTISAFEMYSKPSLKKYPNIRNLNLILNQTSTTYQEIVTNQKILVGTSVDLIFNFEVEYVVLKQNNTVIDPTGEIYTVDIDSSNVKITLNDRNYNGYYDVYAYGTKKFYTESQDVSFEYGEIKTVIFEKDFQVESIEIKNSNGDEVSNNFQISVAANKADILLINGNSSEEYSISAVGYKITNQEIRKNFKGENSGEDLELENKKIGLLPEDNLGTSIASLLIIPYNYTDEYSIDLRGRFDIDLYELILFEFEKSKFIKCVVSSHKLDYNGAYKSTMKLVRIDNKIYSKTYPNNSLYPSNNLYPSNKLKVIN